jgi:hypothetical protein
MPDDSVVERPPQTGGGGRRTRWTGRGGRGFELTGSGSGAGTPAGDDFDRLAGMVERIGNTLKSLIYLEPPLLPPGLRDQFIVVWPETEREISLVVSRLRRDPPPPRGLQNIMYRSLQAAGLAGSMLEMKEKSLNLHLDSLGEAMRNYSPPDKQVLTLPEDKGLIRRLLALIRPAAKVMNSVMGSLPAVVFPGKEMVKEVKEHVEAGYEAAEISQT